MRGRDECAGCGCWDQRWRGAEDGAGNLVEYAGKTGTPVWTDPAPSKWDYTQFASTAAAAAPDETVTLTFRDSGALKGSKFDTGQSTINPGRTWTDSGEAGKSLPAAAAQRKRRPTSDSSAPPYFEVAQIGHKQLSGLRKDVINVMPLETVAVDFAADNPGDTLLHCHRATAYGLWFHDHPQVQRIGRREI